jgi:hypothetical protein
MYKPFENIPGILLRIFDLQDDVIVWKNRFNGQPDMENIQFDCMISLNCLDCPCSEPYSAVKSIYSKKFNGPGIKYEVGTCIIYITCYLNAAVLLLSVLERLKIQQSARLLFYINSLFT